MERTAAGRTSRGAGGGKLGCGRSDGEPDLLLRWGNRKRLRCVKIHARDEAAAAAGGRATARDPCLLCRAPSPHRSLGYNTRNSEASAIMKAQQQQQQGMIDGGSAEGPRGGSRKAGNGAAVAAAPKDSNRKGASCGGEAGSGSSSSGSEAAVWPNVVISLTAREKEEDFMAFKGTKLPQRPKKRAKLIQRTLNQVSPGAWLCDLTLERYEVREKKVSKKTPRGLKAMGSMESESE